MESQLAYHAFAIRIPQMTEKELYEQIRYQSNLLDKHDLFQLCFHCNKVNPTLFPIFYITLTRMYPLSSLRTHLYNLTWLSTFQWSNYIDIMTELSDRNLLTKDNSTLYDSLNNAIIDILVDNLFTERYYATEVSTLGLYLPREGKNLDKRTKIVKKLAYAYYNLFMNRNKEDNEWDDVSSEFNRKNKAMKLYRKDVSYIANKARKQNAQDHFSL